MHSGFTHIDTRTLLGRLWRHYLRGQIGIYTLAVFLMLIVGLCTAGLVRLVEPMLDDALIAQDLRQIWLIAAGFFAISLIRGLANYAQTVLLARVGLKIIERMQNQMMKALLHFDLIDLQHDATAQHLSRFSNDVNALRAGIAKAFTGIGRDLSILVFMIYTMFDLHSGMAAGAVLLFPLAIWPVRQVGRRIRKVTYVTQKELALMTAVLDDSLKGARQVRADNLQTFESRRASANFATILRLTLKQIAIRALTHPIMDGLSGLTIGAVLVWAGYLILGASLSVGQFMAFFVAIFAAYQPMRSLANINASLQEALAGAQRIFALIDNQPSITSKPGAPQLMLQKGGAITFNQVTFAYPGEDPVLEQFDLEIEAHKTTALVGPSGGGKSTILNLIPRFFEVGGGQISIDGQDIRSVDLASLRQKIALVSQEQMLFNTTIAQNIAFGCPDASRQAIIKAAEGANARTFIEALAEGFDTNVGEQGIKLSGGQRQRIAIARALLKDAPILLLDEATSALDRQSEQTVQDALELLMHRRTVLIVAHRLVTVQDAAKICVIEAGKLTAQGTHHELLALGGSYAHGYQMQDTREAGSDHQPAIDKN
ncbi:MAG: ABC transporter ATP-binding protein [Pseudomonadota bacterium]